MSCAWEGDEKQPYQKTATNKMENNCRRCVLSPPLNVMSFFLVFTLCSQSTGLVSLVCWSSTLLYIDLIWFLTGNALENYYAPNSRWLHPWVFGGNVDVVLNEIGIVIICGLVGSTKLQGWKNRYMIHATHTAGNASSSLPSTASKVTPVDLSAGINSQAYEHSQCAD